MSDTELITHKDFASYLIEDERFRERFEAYLHDPQLHSLDREIALLRVTLENELNREKQNVSAIRDLSSVIAKLLDFREKSMIRQSHMLTKDAVLRFAKHVVGVVTEEMRALPDYEERMDRVIDQIMNGFDVTANREAEIKQLERAKLPKSG